MTSIAQSLRDNIVYATGYLQGRSYAFPRSVSEVYAMATSKLTSLIALPLPFLSFLALPFFSGTSTTVSLAFFYLTWSAFVFSHGPHAVEIYGNVFVRLLCFVAPALLLALFDSAVPAVGRGLKNRGASHLPLAQFGRNKLFEVAGVAVANIALSIAVQAALEFVVTDIFHLRSLLKVTTLVPLPWNILKHIVIGFALRGILIYIAHRYLLHTFSSPLKTWHLRWQHSVKLPFSLVAAYDHPINFLLLEWLPAFLPAYLFRFHVLTWHLFLALCSLEELLVYSGYAVLPSQIILLGMARRTDEHFALVDEGKKAGNFGRTGILDFVCGTTCNVENDAMDDVQSEAEKHNIQQRATNAVDGAISGLRDTRATTKAGKPGTRARTKASREQSGAD